MTEYWVTLRPTKHALAQAKARGLTIPKKVNMADPETKIFGPWYEKPDEPKFLLFVPLKAKDGSDSIYHKRIPVSMKGNTFQELDALSIMLRESKRIGRAKPFKAWLKDLNDAGLLF